MPDTTVKYYDSTMSGAPSLSGTAGQLITLLDACLANGFGSVTLDSLVVADDVATGTVSAGHNFAMLGATGPVITIAGATPSGLNGEWRIASIPGSTTFTFATSGISDQTATGTITASRSPAGFSKVYSGTNKGAYQANSVQSTRLFLRVDDSVAQYPPIKMYETMSGVDTGTGVAPTSGSLYFPKSSAASSSTRAWRLYADHRAFYLVVDASNNGNYGSQLFFGDINSYVSGDTYGCGVIASDSANTTTNNFQKLDSASASPVGGLLARDYTKTGSAVTLARYSHSKTTSMGYNAQAYPNAAIGGILCWPVEVWEGTTRARGLMPGVWNPVHNSTLTDNAIIDNVSPMNCSLKIQTLQSGTTFGAFDLTGPWRS